MIISPPSSQVGGRVPPRPTTFNLHGGGAVNLQSPAVSLESLYPGIKTGWPLAVAKTWLCCLDRAPYSHVCLALIWMELLCIPRLPPASGSAILSHAGLECDRHTSDAVRAAVTRLWSAFFHCFPEAAPSAPALFALERCPPSRLPAEPAAALAPGTYWLENRRKDKNVPGGLRFYASARRHHNFFRLGDLKGDLTSADQCWIPHWVLFPY